MYDCECGTCKHQKEQITLALEDNFKPVLNAVKKALKTLHTKGNYHPKDLADTKEYIHLIDATNNVFNYALKQVDLSPTMLKHLQNDVYTFSAVKTHTQLLELSRELLTDEKQIKPFATFEYDVSKIVTAYNSHYLEAEYEFAVGGSQMADRWESFSDDERYLLQYRTANDDKVRDSHAVLHNITLPKDDPFWDKYFAPNGWRCRCLVVQLLRALHKTSDSKKAIELGEKATTAIDKNGKNKLEIFRFNPGKKKIIFPPNHPYNKIKGADFVKEEVRKGNIKSNKFTVDLNKHIKGEIPTNKEVKDVLFEYAKLNPNDFRNGLEKVNVAKAKSYLMQHGMSYRPSTGDWVGGSSISISSNTFTSIGMNPLEEFKNALANIKSGKKLTFNQEYSIESMWHEILHAKTKSKPFKLGQVGVKNMETVNQFCARHTYVDFLEKLGGKAIHQKEILENGHGYKSWITNFRDQLKKNGINEKKASKDLMVYLMEDYSTIGRKTNEYIKKHTKLK
ncbi:SPP1 gp7 family putative phage head morphogenesis protein [Wenyingzhuangia heitensis]|uniref:SPP1 gp7 family putative phage head morphogenesis protein n=1 Tax=Wenyingzhuangia heitensis TaxID=1487859 RepID=A0ABX0UDA5_9FLAO|nr:phage minor head protein [Wenyingzhuangia heitensis]NIJ45047.1 SPP1 gp7 family putative phage head morphogenesis protein [Wenyingzhuangia heitensis]